MRPEITPIPIEEVLPTRRPGTHHLEDAAGDLQTSVCGDDFNVRDVCRDFTSILGANATAVELVVGVAVAGGMAVTVGVAIGVRMAVALLCSNDS